MAPFPALFLRDYRRLGENVVHIAAPSMTLQLLLLFQLAQKVAGLVFADPAQTGCAFSRDSPVGLGELQHHLFVLMTGRDNGGRSQGRGRSARSLQRRSAKCV
jgi:hypothetical protein